MRNSTSWVEQVSHERLDGQVVLSIQLKESLSDVNLGWAQWEMLGEELCLSRLSLRVDPEPHDRTDSKAW